MCGRIGNLLFIVIFQSILLRADWRAGDRRRRVSTTIESHQGVPKLKDQFLNAPLG